MEIGKMLNDIRNVLAPQIAAQPAQPNAALAHVGDSFRGVLNPDTAIKPLAPQQDDETNLLWGAPKAKWGYDDEKFYFTDNDPDPVLDTWQNYRVIDNNTGKMKTIGIMRVIDTKKRANEGDGYFHESSTGDRIGAVREVVDGEWVEHKGIKDITDFFRKNFDMDAGDYSVLEELKSPRPVTSEDNKWGVVYDTKTSRTPFIPSQIFLHPSNYSPDIYSGNRIFSPSQLQPVISPQPDTRAMSVTDFLRLTNGRSMGVPLLDAQPKWWRGKENVTPVAPLDAYREGNEPFKRAWNV